MFFPVSKFYNDSSLVDIMTTANHIKNGIRAIKGIKLLGNPEMSGILQLFTTIL